MDVNFSIGAILFLAGSYTFDYEEGRGIVLSYATAVLFTVGSAGFFIGVMLLIKFYFGDHPPRAIPLISAQ